jgi:cytoskeletal protein RodZ
MNTRAREILDAAGMKNPKDIALVEAIEATTNSQVPAAHRPVVMWLAILSLVANIALAAAWWRSRAEAATLRTTVSEMNSAITQLGAITGQLQEASRANANAADSNRTAVASYVTSVERVLKTAADLAEKGGAGAQSATAPDKTKPDGK